MKAPGNGGSLRPISFSTDSNIGSGFAREYFRQGSHHVDISRLISFLVEVQPLTPEEHSHLLKCEDCMNRTVDAVFEEIERRREARETA